MRRAITGTALTLTRRGADEEGGSGVVKACTCIPQLHAWARGGCAVCGSNEEAARRSHWTACRRLCNQSESVTSGERRAGRRRSRHASGTGAEAQGERTGLRREPRTAARGRALLTELYMAARNNSEGLQSCAVDFDE